MALEMRIAGKFRLIRKLGSGSFGEIYLGVNTTNGEEVAVKLEQANTKHPQLHYESKVYKALSGGIGIPNLRFYGTEADYNTMVIDVLGPSLEDLFTFCGRKLSLKTVLMLADQMIARVEFMHTRGYLHRDIKPDNFLMGIGKREGQVYIIDFGLAKRYRDPRTGQHIPYKDNKSLTGTARYASINTHLGIEQARRDDLEALAYVFMYFLRGSLPWQGLQAANKKQKYDRISEKKVNTSVDVLCKGYPEEFAVYLNYCKTLKFEEKPDYSFLRKLLRDAFIREGFQYDNTYDWILLRTQKGTSQSSRSEPVATASRPTHVQRDSSNRPQLSSTQPWPRISADPLPDHHDRVLDASNPFSAVGTGTRRVTPNGGTGQVRLSPSTSTLKIGQGSHLPRVPGVP
eukprot:TRINITY_DN7176_c0_g1_i3.p1 TRINITY_DN7176_c0_g1~~TRINITY_DN7176_c0_g1_i3.p1  ORF type:complete len:401 (+),score=60.77 TRINITY_DN7176_c0_g1_i3:101-1303(+)